MGHSAVSKEGQSKRIGGREEVKTAEKVLGWEPWSGDGKSR